MTLQPSHFFTNSMSAANGAQAADILAHAFNAVDPADAVRWYLSKNQLPVDRRIYLLALGKAACGMAGAVGDFCSPADALIIPKHASTVALPKFTLLEGDHPVPGSRSVRAGAAALQFVGQCSPSDLLLCLISGGGSALMTAPRVPLPDLQQLTSSLLACGARIDEINILRRHLDHLKGGGVVRAANGANVLSLILSDVVEDPIETIASGPTAPDPSCVQDAINILDKYSLRENLPASILDNLTETLKPSDPIFDLVQNQIVASNSIALQAAVDRAKVLGLQVRGLQTGMQGEARLVGAQVAEAFRDMLNEISRPFVVLAGGETTVTLRGSGKGGRNQETALAAVEFLDGLENVLFISVATDGEDGPTDAAGAVVNGMTLQRAKSLGLHPSDSMQQSDSYHFFDALGDLIRCGPSGTNVNDLILCFAF